MAEGLRPSELGWTNYANLENTKNEAVVLSIENFVKYVSEINEV